MVISYLSTLQGKKDLQPRLYYQVNLQELVPEGNYDRQLDKVFDLQWLYKATAKYQGREGHGSIDPVVFMKMLLVGYLNNIGSDCRLVEYCANRLDVRLFLRYDIDQALPWPINTF